MNEKKKIKIEHFKNLVAVAIADGLIEKSEMEFLTERATDYGMTQKEIEEVLAIAEQLPFVVPLNNIDKEEQLSDIVYMTMIDGVVREQEYELCLRIAQRLDMTQKDLDHVIELTKELWEKED